MHRLFIVLPVYAVVVIFLPRQPWFQDLMQPVMLIEPDTSFWVSMCLGAASALAFWMMRSRPAAWMLRKPRVAEVIGFGFMGVIFAAVFDLFERLAGGATTLISVILIPLGFMIAETVYLAVQWRMSSRRGQDE